MLIHLATSWQLPNSTQKHYLVLLLRLPPAKRHTDMTSFTLTESVWAKGVGRSLTAFPREEREAQRGTVACPRSHRQLVEELGLLFSLTDVS